VAFALIVGVVSYLVSTLFLALFPGFRIKY
jgi:hypothetical protein